MTGVVAGSACSHPALLSTGPSPVKRKAGSALADATVRAVSQRTTRAGGTYYSFFDTVTRRGKVFAQDMSNKDKDSAKLTEQELCTRKRWAKKLKRIRDEYLTYDTPDIKDCEDILEQRLAAPYLSTNVACPACSSRHTDTRSRVIPPEVVQRFIEGGKGRFVQASMVDRVQEAAKFERLFQRI
jgi:hypothetical protein